MKADNKHLPLISVVVATYNGEKYLREQIDSIISQSYPNIETIVIDDCSTDHTIKILEEYKKRNVLKYFKQEKNVGVTKNFEFGFKKAKGDFIAPADQDDVWKKNKLETLYNNMDERLAIFSDSEIMLENGTTIQQTLSKGNLNLETDSCLQFIFTAKLPGHALLFQKKLLEKTFPFPKKIVYDQWIGFHFGLTNGIKYLPITLVQYRQHSDNTFGTSYKGKKEKRKISPKEERINKSIYTLEKMFNSISSFDIKEKFIIKTLLKTYQSNSILNRFKRAILVFNNRKTLLKHKNYGVIRKLLFSVKTFFKLVDL